MLLYRHLHPISTILVKASNELDEHFSLQLEKILARSKREISDVSVNQLRSFLMQILPQLLDYVLTLVLLKTCKQVLEESTMTISGAFRLDTDRP